MQAPSDTLNAALTGAPELARLPGRDLVEVARYLIPLEANLVQGCLVASGIPAVLADAHLVQTDMLLAPALGGVRILVPADHLQQARAVLEAFARGEFELGEDADVG
ncbi:MAG: putative signal transducing protein [Massilia sp.]